MERKRRIMRKRRSIINLLKLAKEMSQDQEELNNLFGENEYMYYKVDDLVDIILDLIEVGDDERGLKRDPFYCVIYDYTLDYSDLSASEVCEKIYKMMGE